MQALAGENMPVLIVALLDADVQEQAFQFIVINNKAVRVPTDNVKAIIAEIDEKRLSQRLQAAGVRYGEISPILYELNILDASPFKDLLDWDLNRGGTRIVPLTAIEQALRYMRAEFTMLDEDEDSLLDIFCAVWRGIKAAFPGLWAKDNKLMKKVCLNDDVGVRGMYYSVMYTDSRSARAQWHLLPDAINVPGLVTGEPIVVKDRVDPAQKRYYRLIQDTKPLVP